MALRDTSAFGSFGTTDTMARKDVVIPVIFLGTPGDDYLVFFDGTIPTYSAGTDYLGAVYSAGDGNDMLSGSFGPDAMNGGNGNDFIKGYYGDDKINGGDGIDTVDYRYYGNHLLSPRPGGGWSSRFEGVTIDLGNGYSEGHRDGVIDNDTLISIENATGSEYKDIIHGSGVDNTLEGRNGNDYLFGWDGFDTLYGGGGRDIMAGGEGDDTLIGGEGDDHVVGGAGTDTVSYLYAVRGLTISLAGGTATDGLYDNDTLIDIETVTGSNFNDSIEGNDAANRLEGRGGNDWLQGNGGDDRLYGGYDDDALNGGAGADFLDGGPGRDTAEFADSGVGVDIDLDAGVGLFGDAQGDVLESIENAVGSAFVDNLRGSTAANHLFGMNGADFLFGEGNNDQLFGGNGRDTLMGGDDHDSLIGEAGADILDGGAGIDTASYSDSFEGVTVSLVTGIGSGGDAEGDTLFGVENLFGSANDDVLTGDGGNNLINAGVGNDLVDGGAGHDYLADEDGNDTMLGRGGNDMILAGWGNDDVSGAAGDDYIFGDRGRDQLTGGNGADSFVYRMIQDSTVTAAGRDTIGDFEIGTDKIDLSGIDAFADGIFNDAFSFVGEAALTGAGQVHIRFDNGSTIIEGDVDGLPGADFAIVLVGTRALTAADFVL